MFSYLATTKPDLGQYGITRNFAKSMEHEMTVFLVYLATKRCRYWFLTPFNNIARFVERMLNPTTSSADAAAA
ncbi:MAG: hypothetical protein AUK50_10710 [Comamonadaceae bacterium CG2_30_57_122]|nr:MAG: hypothetical protein AUK50_10710 [Comamonadaceae bacterium CG2_30_57_122]